MTFSTEKPSRRAALGAIVSVPALALPTVAMAASDDSEILAIAAEIRVLDDRALAVQAERIDPFEEEFVELAKTDWKAACAFGDASGREAAVMEREGIDLKASRLFEQMLALPASTQAGRAAKVRTLLANIRDWRGPGADLDWEIDMMRKLLGEYAGMSEEELANV
jgi:hypothetical protein